jgi:ATP-dependent Clp protease protease subunit
MNNYRVLPRLYKRLESGEMIAIDPYDRLYEDRVVFLSPVIDAITANDVVSQLLALEADDPARDIILYINSISGYSPDMTSIIDTMEYIKPDVQTMCLGSAELGSALILAAGTKGKRYILPNAMVTLHQPTTHGESGKATALEVFAQQLDHSRRWMEGTLSRLTGQPVDKVHKDIEYNTILMAQDAVDYGIVDHIINPQHQTHLSDAKQ